MTTKCTTCDGKGATRTFYASRKVVPCRWHDAGAKTCDDCDGTGMVETTGKEQA